MHLFELLDKDLLAEMENRGYVRRQVHPSQPLAILNYTEKAQFDKMWNGVTLRTRGLIYNTRTMQIAARPFEKFFNFGEHWSHDLMSDSEPVVVTDKMDGSLGIMYLEYDDAGYPVPSIATRGSFMSDQAIHANGVLIQKYPDFQPRVGWTYLFEIVYPENRIVVNYQGQDDLVLIGAVDIRSGVVLGPEMLSDWPGPKAEVFPYRTLGQALSAPPRPGKEGLVVRSLVDGMMVKLKQQDYVELHRIVTNLNPRTIWDRCMKADLEIPPGVSRKEKVMDGIPDEFFDAVWDTANDLFWKVMVGLTLVHNRFLAVSPLRDGELGDRSTRALFASRITDELPWLRSALWLMYDGKDRELRQFLWKSIKPRGESK